MLDLHWKVTNELKVSNLALAAQGYRGAKAACVHGLSKGVQRESVDARLCQVCFVLGGVPATQKCKEFPCSSVPFPMFLVC